MSEHDPLCPAYKVGPLRAICECVLIRAARADERERIARAIEAHGPIGRHSDARWMRADAARIAREGGTREGGTDD